MTIGSAMAKILHARSYDELEQAANDFTEAQETLRQELEGLLGNVLFQQPAEGVSLSATEEASTN